MIAGARYRFEKVRFRRIQSREDDLLKVCAERRKCIAVVARTEREPFARYQLFEASLSQRPYEIVMPDITMASRVVRAAERAASDDQSYLQRTSAKGGGGERSAG